MATVGKCVVVVVKLLSTLKLLRSSALEPSEFGDPMVGLSILPKCIATNNQTLAIIHSNHVEMNDPRL